MGSADIIPGVSGGTIALITGIYERLLSTLKSINVRIITYFIKGFINRKYFQKSKEMVKEIDVLFLASLIAGIGLAFLTLSHIIGFFLDTYPTYTYAFFFGLILSSAIVVVLSHKNEFLISALIFFAIGVVVGYLIVGLDTFSTNHSVIIIFLSGTISFCAMILPGISGAFILILLGQYSFMLGILRELGSFNFSQISLALTYLLGGIIGLLSFSRLLSYLLKKHRSPTLSFIIGLMIGALRQPMEYIIFTSHNILIIVLCVFIGLCTVFLFSIIGRKVLLRENISQRD